jgi:hypothetical protein
MGVADRHLHRVQRLRLYPLVSPDVLIARAETALSEVIRSGAIERRR